MYFYRENDIVIDLKKMKKLFLSNKDKEVFLEWFLSSLQNVEIVMRLRHIGRCYICEEFNTLDFKGVKNVGAYKYKIPNGESSLIVDSSILHLVSVHNLVPDRLIIEALEKIQPRISDS